MSDYENIHISSYGGIYKEILYTTVHKFVSWDFYHTAKAEFMW